MLGCNGATENGKGIKMSLRNPKKVKAPPVRVSWYEQQQKKQEKKQEKISKRFAKRRSRFALEKNYMHHTGYMERFVQPVKVMTREEFEKQEAERIRREQEEKQLQIAS